MIRIVFKIISISNIISAYSYKLNKCYFYSSSVYLLVIFTIKKLIINKGKIIPLKITIKINIKLNSDSSYSGTLPNINPKFISKNFINVNSVCD